MKMASYVNRLEPMRLTIWGLALLSAAALTLAAKVAASEPHPRNGQGGGETVLEEFEYDLNPGWWQYVQSCDSGKWISYGQKFESRPDFRARCDLQIHNFETEVKPTLSKTMEIPIFDSGTIMVRVEQRVSKEHGQEPAVGITLLKKDGRTEKVGFASVSKIAHATGEPVKFTPPKPAQIRQVEKGDRIAIKIDAGWAKAGWANFIPAQGTRVKVFAVPDSGAKVKDTPESKVVPGSAAATPPPTATLILGSGSYRVDTWASGLYPSVWKLNVSSGRISGMSEWGCCPGPRNDPLSGRIDGNTVTITRDCTGQGNSGPCSQEYTGKLNGNVIEGSFTHNERKNIGTWKLYLDSKKDPATAGSAASDAPPNFDQVVSLPCASDEDFVRSLYLCITHREPAEQEIRAQVARLRDGAPRQHMIAYFFASPGYVNQNHDGVRFMKDACQAIYARQPTASELKAWPRTDRKTIINEMFKNPAHLAATKDCEALWRKKPAGEPPSITPDGTRWKTQHTGSHASICPKADQWSTSGGGFMVMSGAHRFDKHWFRFGGSPEGPYYLNGEDKKSPPRHSLAEVTQHVKIKQGTLTVRGPGALAYYFRRKGTSPHISLSDTNTGQRFHPQTGGDQTMYQARNWVFKDGKWDGAWIGDFRGNVNDLYGDRPMGGWVPAGQIKTLDVFVEQGWYSVGGTSGFGAPSEIEYELWFFPREGGGVKTKFYPLSAARPVISPNAQ